MVELWRTLSDLAMNYADRIVGAVIIFLVGWIALRYLVGASRRWLERTRVDPSVASFLVNSARGAILVAVFLAILQQFGMETTSLLTLVGAAGVTIALSLQNALANFASGLIILSFRMVRIGDHIEVGDCRGQVTEILPFHIILTTVDNQRISLPNTLLTNGPVRNNSALPTHCVQWSLPIGIAADLTHARQALLARLHADERLLTHPPPQVFVQEWALDKVVLTVVAWTATEIYPIVQKELYEELGKSLEPVRRQANDN